MVVKVKGDGTMPPDAQASGYREEKPAEADWKANMCGSFEGGRDDAIEQISADKNPHPLIGQGDASGARSVEIPLSNHLPASQRGESSQKVYPCFKVKTHYRIPTNTTICVRGA